jgi:predicted nucleic acid-binding protein
VIFVDSNIPMYLVGAPHPRKVDSQRIVEGLIAERRRLVSDVEVLQEILHRYVAVERREMIQPAFDSLFGVVDEIFPVHPSTLLRAKEIVLARRKLSARDALHLAVMEEQGVKEILTFDAGFEGYPGITRLH